VCNTGHVHFVDFSKSGRVSGNTFRMPQMCYRNECVCLAFVEQGESGSGRDRSKSPGDMVADSYDSATIVKMER
jgi:hypothetical protein